MAGNSERVSSGAFLAASPMTSTLRTKARLRTSLPRKSSRVVCAAWVCKNSASRRMSRSSSTVEGSIAHRGQNQTCLRLGKGLVGHQVHAPAKEFLQQLVQREEIVVGALAFLELDIDVNVAVRSSLVARERTEHADASRPQGTEFGDAILNGSQRIHCARCILQRPRPPFKPVPPDKRPRACGCRSVCCARKCPGIWQAMLGAGASTR